MILSRVYKYKIRTPLNNCTYNLKTFWLARSLFIDLRSRFGEMPERPKGTVC